MNEVEAVAIVNDQFVSVKAYMVEKVTKRECGRVVLKTVMSSMVLKKSIRLKSWVLCFMVRG